MPNDPLLQLDPLIEDPLAKLDPPPGTQLGVDPLGQLEGIDSKQDKDDTLGTTLKNVALLQLGQDPRAPDAPGWGDMIGFFGKSLNELKAETIEAGQAVGEALRQPIVPVGKDATEFPSDSSTLLSQTLDVAGQITSSPLEMIGSRHPDPESNIVYQTGRTIREATRTPEEIQASEQLHEQFSRAVLQTGSFILGGKGAQTLLKEAPRAAGWIAGALGMAVGGQMGEEDARAYGATDEQIQVSRWMNEAFGATEAVPIALGLGRIDDLTGGFLSRKFKNKIGQIAGAGIASAIEEGLQEGFQTFGENWTAKDVAIYDPSRSYTENLMAASGMGGSVGFLFGLLGGALGVRRRGRVTELKEEVEQDVLELTGAKDISEISGGPLSILSEEYLTLMEAGAVAQGTIEERGIRAPEEEVTTFTQTVQKLEDEIENNLPDISADWRQNRSIKERLRILEDSTGPRALAIRMAAKTTLINEELEGEKTIRERVKETPVVVGLVQEVQNRTVDLEQLRKHRKILAPSEKQAIKYIDTRIRTVEAILKAEKKLAKELKSLTARLRPLVGKDARIVVNNTFLSRTKSEPTRTGSYIPVDLNGDGVAINFINLKTDAYFRALAEETMLGPEEGRKARTEFLRAKVTSTYLHEMGHAIAFNRFHAIYNKIDEGTATAQEQKVFSGLRRDYYQWVTENLNQPMQTILETGVSITRAGEVARSMGASVASPLDVAPTLSNIPSAFGNAIALGKHDARFLNYMFSFEEFLAEEFNKLAEKRETLINPDTKSFVKEGINTIRSMLEKVPGKFKNQSPTLDAYFKLHSVRGQLREAGKQIAEHTTQNPFAALEKADLLPPELKTLFSGELDKFNKFMDIGFNILQIAEQNPNLLGLQNYVQHLREWKNEVNNNLAIADTRLTDWKNLGKEAEQLGRLLLDETIGRLPDGGWLAEPRAFTDAEIQKYKLSDLALKLRQDIKADFTRVLDEMESVLLAAKRQIFADDEVTRTKEILAVQKEFKDMRGRPYFPLMRFGDYVLQVRARGEQRIDGKDYKDGDIVDYQTFDTKKKRDKARGVISKQYVPEHVTLSVSHRRLPNFSLQGMPLTLVEHLEGKLISSQLDPEVRKAIQEVKNDVLPFKSFRRQFQRRKRVEGYSIDAQRSYANYMTSFSNHLARVKFDPLFKEDFDAVEASIKVIDRQDEGDSTKRAQIFNHMQDHLQYVMNPVNEFVGLRSVAFVWYLGFNLKSAFVNTTQVPLVTYPYLAARFGDGKAVAQITRAYKTAVTALRNPKKLSSELQELIETGLNESWLDESLATELAQAASEGNLDMTLPKNARQKTWRWITTYGSLPFHAAEKLNRHTTAIAAYRLARAADHSHKRAIFEARRAVEKSQYEYARWARPRFMRGKVGGTVFVFQNFMQNSLYFALGGDPGALRMLAMLFFLAGLQGLPFGENLADLVDAMMTFLKKKTGTKDPYTQVRTDLRESLNEIGVNPDLILHGLSSSTFGLANIGEAMGWPIPDLDLSGSLSMGRIIPGTELLAPGQGDTFEKVVGRGFERTGGAIASGFASMGQAILSSHPDEWKRWERALPSALRQISKAVRIAQRGGEATRAGYPIAGYDMHDPQDQMELIAQSAGFTPRALSRGWEGFIAKQQAVIYYETWKGNLLRQWNYAKEKKDQEAVKAANASIRKYNSQVPFPEMKIGSEARRMSYETYLRTRAFNAKQIEQSKAFRRLSDSIEAVYAED